jgi:hypothetical protein
MLIQRMLLEAKLSAALLLFVEEKYKPLKYDDHYWNDIQSNFKDTHESV